MTTLILIVGAFCAVWLAVWLRSPSVPPAVTVTAESPRDQIVITLADIEGGYVHISAKFDPVVMPGDTLTPAQYVAISLIEHYKSLMATGPKGDPS